MKKKNFLLLFFCLTILFNLFSFGDAINLSKSNSESFWPAIATNSNGEIMVIFTEIVPGGYTDIFYTISTDGGENWTQPTRTYSRRAYIKALALAADSNGNFHMAYADGYASAGREIYYRAYINGNWQAAEQLSYSHDNSNWCRICTDGNTVHVAWYQERGWPAKCYIALKSKQIGGSWPSSTVDVSRNPSDGAMYSDIKAKLGNIYAIYVVHDYSGNTLLGKHLGYSERINGTWHGPTKLGWGTWPALDVDAYGNVHGLYPSGSGGGFTVYKAKINGTWIEDQWINDKSIVSCFFDIQYQNNFLVAAYMQESSIDPKYYSIYYNTKQYKNGWGQWSTSFEIEPGYYAELPRIGMDSSGGAHIVWADIGNGNKTDIYYKKVPLFQSDKPYIDVDKSYLSFSSIEGESPSQQTFQIKNSGVSTLSYNIYSDQSWLIVSPISGASTGEWDQITVTADTSHLGPGNYSGKITIAAPQAPNSPLEIGVTLLVGTETPTIELDNDSLSFSHVEGSSNPPSQSFQIRNFGHGALNYQFNTDKSWVSISPLSGTSNGEWDTITVSINASSLGAGDHFANITTTSPEADNSPQQLDVSVHVTSPGGDGGGGSALIQLDKATLNFTNTTQQYFKVRNSGAGVLSYKIAVNKGWISVSPTSGSSNGEWKSIKVTVNPNVLPYGVHNGKITVTSSGASNSPRTLNIILTKQKPKISLNRLSLYYSAVIKENAPEKQWFKIRNVGSASLNYSIKTNKGWLKVTPSNGNSSGEWDTINVSLNISSLSLGTHKGTITVTAPGAENTPQYVAVTLDVVLPPEPYSPINAKLKRMAAVGLLIQDYVNMITWEKNPKNNGIFNIVKFRVFRKLKGQSDWNYVYIAELDIGQPLQYLDHFSNSEDRNKYYYAVVEVDDQNKESHRVNAKLIN